MGVGEGGWIVHIVVVSEVAVGNGNGGGTLNSIDDTIGALVHGKVVKPNVGCSEKGDAITIAPCPQAKVVLTIPDNATFAREDVMDMDVMNDDVLDKLECNTSPISNMHIGSPTIDGFVAGHNELLFQPDHHPPSKSDPKWAILDHSMTQSSGTWVNNIISRISDNVKASLLSTGSTTAKSKCAISQPLPVLFPVGFTSPALVDRVGCLTRTSLLLLQHPPRGIGGKPHQGLGYMVVEMLGYFLWVRVVSLLQVFFSLQLPFPPIVIIFCNVSLEARD